MLSAITSGIKTIILVIVVGAIIFAIPITGILLGIVAFMVIVHFFYTDYRKYKENDD